MAEAIPVNEPLLDGNERKYLTECIDTGWVGSEGPFVTRFEQRFAETVGRKHAIAVSNGTAALDAAVAALEIGPGDEVILPTFTIISCIQQIVRSGARPVLVDCDPATWNMDTSQIEAKITSKTKAIMAVHVYGLPVDMDRVTALARTYDLRVIEDSAEMLGQTYRGTPCGGFGDVGTFSFYPNKHVTTGEGGMIVTGDDRLAERCRSLRNLCFQPERRFVHEELGWNLRMTNMQAAVGVAQLERLPQFVDKKRAMGRLYSELLSDVPGLQLPTPERDYADSIFWVYGIVLRDSVPFDAAEMAKRLAALKIGTRPFFWCMHEQPVLRRLGWFANERYPVAERIARRGLYVPSGLALTSAQIARVAACVKQVLADVPR